MRSFQQFTTRHLPPLALHVVAATLLQRHLNSAVDLEFNETMIASHWWPYRQFLSLLLEPALNVIAIPLLR